MLSILLVFGLVAAGCGNDDDDEPGAAPAADDAQAADDAPAPDDAPAADDEPAAADEMNMTPGEGVSVTMARANWTTGYMQAAIYHHLLEELGYEVSEPADLELAPANAYVAMAEGAFDFWVNSWYPNHDPFLNGEMPDGSLVNEHVSVVGSEMLAGGLEGLMTNKSLVDEHGITTFDQIVNDDALFELYESTDPNPGDGVLQILGCIEGWGCYVALAETIELAGYGGKVEQLEAGGYDAVIAEAVSRAESGTPFIAYTWTPSGYVTQLIPGVNAMWLAHEADKVHDGSTDNPGFAVDAPASLGTDVCTNDPCWLFRNSADIKVTANNDFLTANPSAARLFEVVQISVVDVALQNVLYDGGENTTDDVNRHASDWIADNRDTVDGWLADARSATEFMVTPAAAPAPDVPFRVAVVAPSASNDLAFTQSMVDAVNALLDAGHISEVAITDGTFIVEDAGAAIRGYAEDGYDLVIAHGSQYGGPLQEIAPDFPDVSFAWGTAVDTFGIPNVNSYSVRSDLGGYVNGVVAAQLTESNVIGVIGPIEVGDAKLYVDGFAAGATAQNPDVEVNIVYTGSFADVALAAEAAQSHISAGADVLTGSAQMVVGATGVAQENGVLWFGTQANQTALGEDIVVASQVYRWEVILSEVVNQVKSGTLGGTTFIMTFEGGGLEIQFNDAMDIPAAVLDSAQATIDGLSDGSISTGQ
ncbi:BMP family ABC transporter substrate-binding protein [Candidatus Poriferisocius sp.]|uniref:BMP family ABC transporter substrate-binding protein n=1 Tax=Candidatus Poriferisocius sp. TaxID=3101276 RepID=UPI003B014B28